MFVYLWSKDNNICPAFPQELEENNLYEQL